MMGAFSAILSLRKDSICCLNQTNKEVRRKRRRREKKTRREEMNKVKIDTSALDLRASGRGTRSTLF